MATFSGALPTPTRGIDESSKQRTISVSATGELSVPPDRVKLSLRVRSSKESADEAKQSVHRRFEYIVQTLKKNHVKVSG